MKTYKITYIGRNGLKVNKVKATSKIEALAKHADLTGGGLYKSVSLVSK